MYWLIEGDKFVKNLIIYSVYVEIYLILRLVLIVYNLLWWFKILLDMNDVSFNCIYMLV